MVSKSSTKKAAAIELIKFLTSPEIQRVNATTRGYAPTRPKLCDESTALKENPLFAALGEALSEGAVTRPSTSAGPRYELVSTAYFTAVRQALVGQKSDHQRFDGTRKGPPRHDLAIVFPANPCHACYYGHKNV